MRRSLRALVVAALAAAAMPAGVAGQPPVAPGFDFRPPVDAPVIDGWRPPATDYGPGNRGWEYTTVPGEVVRASADGVVSFAGPVAESLHVTVAHRGGLRTTYSHLDTIRVAAGGHVDGGDPVGTTGERLHFGVRLDGAYIDPGVLFRPGALEVRARLVR